MVTVETISIVFTGLSISLAAFYYISTLRNAQKNRQMQLETRQAQLFMQIYQEMSSPQTFRDFRELNYMEWDDYDDFERKYGSDYNPEAFAIRYSFWYRINGVGLLAKEGLIDVNKVYDLMNEYILWQWDKWGSILEQMRVLYNLPEHMHGFEYIANEMKRIRELKGYSSEVPEDYSRYFPKE